MLSVIIPANNEGPLIGNAMSALFASPRPATVEIIVVANGCSDDTVKQANAFQQQAAQKGWALKVLDLPEGNKMRALNAADAAASGEARVYLDADVIVSPQLLGLLDDKLRNDRPLYASGTLRLARSSTWTSRAYGRIYACVPFIAKGVPGAGLFAVNGMGRKRWTEFPDIISDDTFVRLQFKPSERVSVPAVYDWPLVEGIANLVKVRRRQNAGVNEIAATYPELLKNDDKTDLGMAGKMRLALRDPVGFLVYAGVALLVKLTSQKSGSWERGR